MKVITQPDMRLSKVRGGDLTVSHGNWDAEMEPFDFDAWCLDEANRRLAAAPALLDAVTEFLGAFDADMLVLEVHDFSLGSVRRYAAAVEGLRAAAKATGAEVPA